MRVVLAVAVVLLAFPATGSAGTVTRSDSAITYTAGSGTQGEQVDLGIEGGFAFVQSARGATSASADCAQTDDTRVDCTPAAAFVVNLLGLDDSVNADAVTGPMTLIAHGGAGSDILSGTPNNDALYGEDGGDNLYGHAGNDLLDGGAGDNTYDDGAGDDTIVGGPNNDTWHPGPGRDSFSGGAGDNTVDYRDRTAPVTVTVDGQADDGEAGEGDNVGTQVEEIAGGSGNDRLAAGAFGANISGGAGNDTITGSPEEDRLVGDEGDDVIDSRDGRYDSIDCGPGNDVLYADPGDSAVNCEVAPDRDGDGTPNEQDCEPDNPAVHPGAAEIYGNATDEDCSGSAQYFTVGAGLTFSGKTKKRPARVRLVKLLLADVAAGDRIVVRCAGKGCPFKKRTLTGSAGHPSVSLVKLLKKRYLRVGATVTVTVAHDNLHTRVFRLKVGKGPTVALKKSCVLVGQTSESACPVPS